MLSKYMQGQKYVLFPEFMNMTDDEIKNYKDRIAHKNPRNLDYRDWFWHHPSSYWLLSWGVSYVGWLTFGGMAWMFWHFGIIYAVVISLLMFGVITYDFINKRKAGMIKGMTFYRMWME